MSPPDARYRSEKIAPTIRLFSYSCLTIKQQHIIIKLTFPSRHKFTWGLVPLVTDGLEALLLKPQVDLRPRSSSHRWTSGLAPQVTGGPLASLLKSQVDLWPRSSSHRWTSGLAHQATGGRPASRIRPQVDVQPRASGHRWT